MADERCEVCGALLTPSEQRVVVEDGGRPLCAVHAVEMIPVDEEAELEP